MVKYTNTPTIGPVFSHLLHRGEAGISDWEDIFSYFKDIFHKTVLDLGCGFGSTFILSLKSKDYHPKRLIHLDANPDVFLRKYLSKKFTVSPADEKYLFYDWSNDWKIVADAQNIPLEDRCIDIVNQDMLLADNPHVDRSKVIEEVKRVLKKGGFYITRDFGHQLEYHDPCFKELDIFTMAPVYKKICD